MDRHRLDLDLHRLDLRFAGSRLVEPQAVARIAQSIERCGQIVPCIVVAVPGGAGTGADPRVLIDGYRRVAALRRLGRDTARVEQWTCDLTEALLGVLARTQDRRFASIEEALLLRELVQGQGLSQHDLARRSGRDVSWVSRRLALLSALPDAALAAVRAGKLSGWAANRIVAPLARANTEHADRLLAVLAVVPLSTRELRCWFEHYQRAARPVRERMLDDPRLFLDARRATDERRAGERLRAGPEGECAADLRCLEAALARLKNRVAVLQPVPPMLIAAVPRLWAALDTLTIAIDREDTHDHDRDPQRGAHLAGAGPQPARDQPPAGAVAQHRAAYPASAGRQHC
jgi:ParB family transcriptional regulator, chromosome partitioning protein